MWGECASQATSGESLRVLEDVIYAHCGECCFSQPAMHHLRSLARMHVVHLHSETAQLSVSVKSGAHLVSVANCSVMHTTIMTTNAINGEGSTKPEYPILIIHSYIHNDILKLTFM